jgi:hypothetical protein
MELRERKRDIVTYFLCTSAETVKIGVAIIPPQKEIDSGIFQLLAARQGNVSEHQHAG